MAGASTSQKPIDSFGAVFDYRAANGRFSKSDNGEDEKLAEYQLQSGVNPISLHAENTQKDHTVVNVSII